MSQTAQVTVAVAAFFAFLAVIALIRVWVTKRGQPRRVRIGVFIERDHDDEKDS